MKTRFLGGKDRGNVLCDGKPLMDVSEVDTGLGFAIVHERDESGNLIVDDEFIRARLIVGKMQFFPIVDDV